jgi:aminobenzoyl-glutamate utilization protein B
MLGEYDALPGLSQQATPQRAQPEHKNNGYGHGCGHHLLGVASMEGAIAIAQQIKAGKLQGTIRYYGCPAEEGGSAKVFMVNAGLFKDCDAVLHWHPSSRNSAGDRSTLARNAVKFRFHGKAAHAAGAPEQGRSALDAVELTNFAAQLLREHTPDGTRIHHVITAGGAAPNIVPEFAEVYYYIRHPKSNVVRELYKRLVKCAEAGALATETKLEINFQGGILEILPNNILAQVTMKNLRQLNDLEYDDDNVKFAIRIQQSIDNQVPLSSIKEVIDTSGTVGMGSTDVGDVSWVVPTTGFNTACFTPGVPGHSWQAVASGGTDAAGIGMNLASRVIAATAWDLYRSPEILAAAKSELQQRLGSQPYKSLMVPGQKPPLNYRKPPVK